MEAPPEGSRMIAWIVGAIFMAALVLFWSALVVAARADEAMREINERQQARSKENGDTAAP